MGLARSILLWASQNEWLQTTLPRLSFVRYAVRRFMPGENVEAAITAALKLKEEGFGTIFTRLGENITDLNEAHQVTEHYLKVLDLTHQAALPTEVSLKLTQIGLDLSYDQALSNFLEISKKALHLNNFVWIDMEGSAYTDVTIRFYEEARQKSPNVGLCLQAYLYRSEGDLQRLIEEPTSIRLVKGAYNEPSTIAFPSKKKVDENFYKLTQILLNAAENNAGRIVIGTHDENLIRRIIVYANSLNIPAERYEFHMLYGIRRDLQRKLILEGQKVGVLISYGKAWYPWYMRRLAERPANVLFVLKNILVR